MSTFGDDLIQAMTEALAHAKGEGPAIVHAHIAPREVRVQAKLTQAQMADLFQKDRTVIGRHINNVYREGELERDITCAKFAHVGSDNDQQYVCSTYVNDCRKPDGRKGRDGEGSNQFD